VVKQRPIRIASRGSQLALWQAQHVSTSLIAAHGTLDVSIEIIRTTGDRILDVPLAKIGDRGLFTKEIDEALLAGRAELAVHSLKDVPTRLPEGLALAAVGEREDPRDVLITRRDIPSTLDSLPPGARVGTSSLRRRSQLRHLRSDLEVVDLRGNLNTRLAKLDAGEYEAIILAAAGVIRLGWENRISEFLQTRRWVPAVGQGALALICRTDDSRTAELLAPLHHAATASCVMAERAFLRSLEGGCQVPIGALADLEGDDLRLEGFVADVDGAVVLRDTLTGPFEAAAEIGVELAERLIHRGANDILRRVRSISELPGVTSP